MAAFTAELNSFNKGHTTQAGENNYYLAFRKSLPTPVLDSISSTKFTVFTMLEIFQGCPQTSKLVTLGRYFPIIF